MNNCTYPLVSPRSEKEDYDYEPYRDFCEGIGISTTVRGFLRLLCRIISTTTPLGSIIDRRTVRNLR